MESLIRSRSRLSPALTTLVSIFVLLPLVLFIVDAVFRFEISSLTSIFFQLLLRSVVFGFFQALISASLSLVLAFGLSLWLLSLAPELRMRLIALVRPLGQLLFVLPGTAIALLVLALPTFFLDGLEGMGLIVSAHVLWSVFFVATHVFERLNDWLEAEGADLLRASKSLGASPWQSVRSVVFPLLKNETRTWFPLIFLWSFGAFSTVLLLGSGPQHSTPEVLLYYTLINDVESARLLVVFAFTLALQLLLLKVFSSRARFDDETLRLQSPSSLNIERHEKFSLPQSSLFAFVSLALLLATLALIVTQIVAIISAGMPDPSLWSGLVNTWLYAFLATLFALLLFFLAAASSSETRRLLVFLFALSPVLLATSWSRFSFLETRELPTLVPFIVCAFALALLQVPFAALWIERSLGAMNPDLVVYARSAGLSEKQLFWKIRMPCLRPVFEKLLSYVFCISLGEVALASIWLREKPLLSLGARRLAQSYDFAGASWIFVLTLVSAIFAHFVFSRTLRKVFP